jgi:RNA polymerase sigma-70 factor (ECF subfamily)
MTATPDVREAMLAAVPSLRAFAFTLTHSVDQTDDLVQEAILRAWANLDRFEPDTNLHAWLFTILRNAFYSQHRKTRRELEDPDGHHAGRLWTPPEQQARCDFADMLKALSKLPVEHREALILIAAEGLSYEEAAQVCGVPLGTMKSRAHRARQRLAALLGSDDAQDPTPGRVLEAALQGEAGLGVTATVEKSDKL